jgi:CubicO group peptidase (beta-lactamase class C family)
MSEDFSSLEGLFRRRVSKDGPGLVAAVFREGQALFRGAWGLANIENPVSLSSASVFNSGSLAAQFSAFCILKLRQQKKLSLDDEARKYLPELPNYGESLKLRHLLWHCSGLRCYSTLARLGGISGAANLPSKMALDLACRQRELNFVPGTEYLYSDSNYLLLAEIIARISGRSLADFASKNIFEPYGMARTFFMQDPLDPVRGLVSGHLIGPRGELKVNRGAGAAAGAGRLMTDVEDLGRWARFFSQPKKGDESIHRAMLVPGWLDNGQKLHYGGGLIFQKFRGLDVIRHDSCDAGVRAEFCHFPDQKVTLICLSNAPDLDPTWLCRQAASQIFGKSLQPVSALGPGQPAAPAPRAKLPLKRLKELCGLYREGLEGRFVEISASDQGLNLVGSDGVRQLLAESPSSFQGSRASAIFRLDFVEDGGFILTKQGRASRFAPVKVPRNPAPKKLERFVGRYACPETLSRLEISVRNGMLEVEMSSGERRLWRYLKGGHAYGSFIDCHFSSKGMAMLCPEGRVRRLKWIRL